MIIVLKNGQSMCQCAGESSFNPIEREGLAGHIGTLFYPEGGW